MGSRLRQDPKRFFEVFVEVAPPSSDSKDPFVLLKYPEQYSDDEVLKSIPKFSFPCETKCSTVDHFTFVFTDIESKYRFGFCRHSADAATCLCIVSFLPYYEIFYRLLNRIAEITKDTTHNNPIPLLDALYNEAVATAGIPVIVNASNFNHTFEFNVPDLSVLPSIPDNRNLTEYYNAVDTRNMMIIFASMVFERRILVTSRKLSRLTACVHAAAALLYPMHWQQIYIPVLPAHLIDYVSAPMPFLIGIHSNLMVKAKKLELGDAVILNADTNHVITEYDDLKEMPPEVVSFLRKKLRAQQADRLKSSILGDGVSRAFLRAIVAMIGGYREALVMREGENIAFDRDKFVLSRTNRMQLFLEKLLQLQHFQQFVEERLDRLNNKTPINDEFEKEANLWAEKQGTQYRYSEWAGEMKDKGRKLKIESKEKMLGFTSKVRDKGRKAYKDIRTKLDDIRKDEDGIEPTPLEESPTSETPGSTPMRPPPPDWSRIVRPGSQNRRISYERTRRYPIMDLDNLEVDDTPASSNTSPTHSRQSSVVTPTSPRSHPPLSRASNTLMRADSRNPAATFRRGSSRRSGWLNSTDDADILTSYPRVSIDLMHDPDIQGIFHRSYSTDALNQCGADDEQGSDKLDDTDQDAEEMLVAQCMTDTLIELDDASESTIDENVAAALHCSLADNDVFLADNTTSDPASHVSAPDRAPLRGPKPIPAPRPSIKSKQQSDPPGHSIVVPRPQSRSGTPSPQRVTQGTDLTRRSQSPLAVHSDTAVVGNSSTSHVQNNSNGQTMTGASGGAARSVQRSSVQRRPSVPKTHATNAHSIKEARRAFMGVELTEVVRLEAPHKVSGRSTSPMSNDLDQFDPLVTGQLAVDAGSLSGSGSSSLLGGGSDLGSRTQSSMPLDGSGSTANRDPNEEDLLKEWNLDFKTMSITAKPATGPMNPPPIPPKPTTDHRHSIHLGTGLGTYNNNINTAYAPVPYRRVPLGAAQTCSVYPPAPSSSNTFPTSHQYVNAAGASSSSGGPPMLQPRRPSSVAAALEPIPGSADPFSDVLAQVTNNTQQAKQTRNPVTNNTSSQAHPAHGLRQVFGSVSVSTVALKPAASTTDSSSSGVVSSITATPRPVPNTTVTPRSVPSASPVHAVLSATAITNQPKISSLSSTGPATGTLQHPHSSANHSQSQIAQQSLTSKPLQTGTRQSQWETFD